MDNQAPNQHPSPSDNSTRGLLRDNEFVGGFYLTEIQLEKVANFRPVKLSSGWTLWHDDRGELLTSSDEDQVQVTVFGTFFHLEIDDKSVLAQKLQLALKESWSNLESELDLLVGRYVVLGSARAENHIYHDALGTRSVYYSTDHSVVSSHYNLLARMLNSSAMRTWDQSRMAMDLTKAPTIRQLLPNFRLNYSTRQIKRYFPNEENEFRNWNHEERQAEVTRLWKKSISSLLSYTPHVVFSITGGMDSRLSIAMASRHWHNLSLYTYGTKSPSGTNYSQAMNRDFLIAQKLIDVIQPREYKFLHLKENKAVKAELAALLEANSITKHGPGLVQRYRAEFPGDDWIHVRSTGLEVVRNHFGSDESVKSIIRMCERDGASDFHSRISELGYSSPKFGYNRKDLLYWELRMGKWHSEVLNENDAAFETILPHNSRRILKILLSYSKSERKDAYAIKELINRNAAILNFFGMNDTRNLYEVIRDEHSGTTNASASPIPSPIGKPLSKNSRSIVIRGAKRIKKAIGNKFSHLTNDSK